MNRRAFLYVAAPLALASCGVVTTTTTNGKTTVTVDVAKLQAYGSGITALVDAFLAFPGVSAAMGSRLAEVQTMEAKISGAIAGIAAAANGSQGFSFDTSSPPAFLTSLSASVSALRTDAQAAVTALGSSASDQITQYYQAILAVLSATTLLFAVSGVSAAPAPGAMTVTKALALVHIKAP